MIALGIEGTREYGHPDVYILYDNGIRKPLAHIERHSPDGFEWGYAGSGPADLALSILTYALKNKVVAQQHYMDFKFAFVASWPHDKFFVPLTQICNWIGEQTE